MNGNMPEKSDIYTHRPLEIAIMGAPCAAIQDWTRRLIAAMPSEWPVAWVDAVHHREAAADELQQDGLRVGASVELYHTANGRQVRMRSDYALPSEAILQGACLTLVNGNHFSAGSQILLLHPSKYDSLQRHRDRLSRVICILTTESAGSPPDFLKTWLPDRDIPLLPADQIDRIAQVLMDFVNASQPPIRGLILAGGDSRRMGMDKGLLTFEGKSLRDHMAALLEKQGIPAYFSCKEAQMPTFPDPDKAIADTILDAGPMGGVLSAFRRYPDAAWLVLPVDMPGLSAATLQALTDHRSPAYLATAFILQAGEVPQPFPSLWEPAAFPVLMQGLASGVTSLRDIMKKSRLRVIEAPEPAEWANINTPDAYEAIRRNTSLSDQNP